MSGFTPLLPAAKPVMIYLMEEIRQFGTHSVGAIFSTHLDL